MSSLQNGWKSPTLKFLLAAFAASTALMIAAQPDDSSLPKNSAIAREAQARGYAGGDACFACHDIEAEFKKNPHYKSWNGTDKPWRERGCETCHGPGQAHLEGGGDVDLIFRFTKAKPVDANEQCMDCHLKQSEEHVNFLRNEHGLNTVACTECHAIHTPHVEENLMKASSPALCYDCHNEVRTEFNKPYHHRVNEGMMDCADCHNQHGGYSTRQFASSVGNDRTCFECHADKQGPFVFEHQAVRVEGCASCHEVHGSSNPRLLKRSEVRSLCLDCHSGTVGVPGPAPPGFHNVSRAEWQACTSCHVEIHGSNLHELFFE